MIVIRLNGRPEWREEMLREVDAMARIPGCCDVCWIGCGGTPAVEWHEENGRSLVEAAQHIREKGMRVGIEICSLGHGDSRSPFDVGADNFERMVGPDGFVADGAFCPWGEHVQEYFARFVRAYSICQPDGFYVDDDLRMEFHGRATFGCFCDNCIRRFNETWGTSFSREEIVHLLATDPLWRERYITQTRDGMGSFMRNIARNIHAISPKTQVGYEYVYLTQFIGSDWEPVFRAIREETGLAPLSRPGCFFYEDHEPRKMLDKVLNTSYQNMVVPDYVKSRRPEIENTSHMVLGKSVQGTCVESTLNLAYGCTGLSYSMISSGTEPLPIRDRMWSAFATHRTYWQQLIDDLPGTGVGGVCLAQSPDAWKTVVPGDKGFDWVHVPTEGGRKLCEIGLPMTYEKKFCRVSILHPDMAARLPEADIRRLLAEHVITDGAAIECLRARGFGDSLPVSAEPGTSRTERYTDHPANRELSGQKGIADGFTPGVQVWTFECGEGCEALAYTERPLTRMLSGEEPKHAVSCALVPTAEGGLWGVVGMSLWTVIVNGVRRRQLSYLADFLAGGLPAYLETDDQAMVIPRVYEDGCCAAVTVLNLTIGEAQPLTLNLKLHGEPALRLCRPGYADTPLPVQYENGRAKVVIPPLAAWSTATVRPVK